MLCLTIIAVMLCCCACRGNAEGGDDTGTFPCLVCLWIVLFFVSIARSLNAYAEAWPKNGCYMAICTRHGRSDYGTPKTSLTPTDLRTQWQGGVDNVFDGVA